MDVWNFEMPFHYSVFNTEAIQHSLTGMLSDVDNCMSSAWCVFDMFLTSVFDIIFRQTFLVNVNRSQNKLFVTKNVDLGEIEISYVYGYV